jgi:hypothetical protein
MAAMNTPRLDYHSSSLRLPRYVVLLLATGALLACSAKKSAAGDASTASMSGDECDPNAGSASASLLTNGSFEQPPVPAGGFTVFSTGDTFGGWTVMGDPGNVAPLSTTFSGGDFSFPAEDGQQSVDMTGTSQSLTGISQTVATMPGHTYCLSFWVGNIADPGGGYGTSSTINVLVDGSMVTVATNEDDDTTLSWEQFTSTVHAAGASTTIAFVNADATTDSSNFLDNVAMR